MTPAAAAKRTPGTPGASHTPLTARDYVAWLEGKTPQEIQREHRTETWTLMRVIMMIVGQGAESRPGENRPVEARRVNMTC